VTLALALDALGAALFGLGLVLISRWPQGKATGGFFSKPVESAVMLASVVSVVAGGAVALASLIRQPAVSHKGRWAVRLAVFNSLLLPVMGGIAALLSLVGTKLSVGWGEPYMPFWIASGLGALGLGVIADEPHHRGLLVLPLMLAATALTFVFGDIVQPN
jgi:hypothetical protein